MNRQQQRIDTGPGMSPDDEFTPREVAVEALVRPPDDAAGRCSACCEPIGPCVMVSSEGLRRYVLLCMSCASRIGQAVRT